MGLTYKKEFDCIEMKIKIQEKVQKELEGLSLAERQFRFEKILETDHLFARFLLKTKSLYSIENGAR
jgi:hypothetical protein